MGMYGAYAQLAIGIAGLIYSIVSQEESDTPEPQELQVNNFCRNAPVPIVYGTDKVSGTCIYIGNTGAEYVEGGGKGGFMIIMSLAIGSGPVQQTGWQYSADFCIGMCEGEAYAINNIYLNDISLLDVLDQFGYDFERGTSTQLINSSISDFLTDGSAVPWRHTAYLWMSGQLGSCNQIPAVTAEISGLLSYKAMPITDRWKNLTPCRMPTSSYASGSEDWCSYHVCGYSGDNFFYNWTYPKGDNIVYVISYGSTYNDAKVYEVTISEDWYSDAYLILKVSNNQPSWAGQTYVNNPHNYQTRVELIKGTFPVGITRDWQWFGFTDRSSPSYDASTTQKHWGIFKIDSSNPANMDVWLSYEYCNSDDVAIRKGDYLCFFDYTDFISYVGTWNTTYYDDGSVRAYGLQNAVSHLETSNGMPLSWIMPGIIVPSNYESYQPCCTEHCLEMWYTHLLFRWRRNAYPDPSIYSISSSDSPYFPNITPASFTFPEYTRPFTAIGNNERHPKRYIICQSNIYKYDGNIMIAIWELASDGETCNKLVDFSVSGAYYMYGNYLQQVSVYYAGCWIYMMFNIYQSGMPADYNHKMYRFNPHTNVLESNLKIPARIFRDSHKITKGTNGNILTIGSRQDSLGDYGNQALFMQWDVFPGLGPDVSPIEVCYDLMTNDRYGMSVPTSLFDGSPYISANTTWYNENMYCYDSILTDSLTENYEARFLYSRCFDERKKGFDLIQDILQTCRGFLYYCDGKIKVKIEKGTETPVIYFGNEEVTMAASNHVAGDKDAIYLSDNRVNNYWLGDLVYIFYIDGYGSMPYGVGGYGGTEAQIQTEYGITTPLFTRAIILSSTSTCLTLIENMLYEVPLDTPIIIKKDNFKKDSFQYERKPDSQRMNQIHLEYKRRDDEYRTDVLDIQDDYNIEFTGEIREQSYTMHGIKRDTQARRMLTYLNDYHSCVNWTCNLDTDIVGMLLCIGDIVGISNEVTGWYGKLFRLMEMEEIEDYEHKLKFIEYIPTIYHDEYIPYASSTPIRYDDITEMPDHVLNLDCIEDKRDNKIWIGFSKPITNNTWWVGAEIYHYNPNTSLWEYLGNSYWNTFSSAISSSITSTQTTISFSTTHYDIDKLQNSGIIWIDNEMIYYGAIDDVNHRFLYCERGYKDTLAVAHSSGTCIYIRNTLYSYEYDLVNDVGKTHIFKAISFTVFGVIAEGDTAPTTSVLIEGSYLLPYPVGSLICYELDGG